MVYWELLITIIVAIMGSSGVWGYISHRSNRKDGTVNMLKGMAQHMIRAESTRLIEQGYVTVDEYRNLHKGLYTPYVQLGGNGIAEKILKEVDNLPIYKEKHE